MKYYFSFILIMIFSASLFSQEADWIDQMQDPSVNFYTVQQNFDKYWEGREVEKGKGWKQYKRWEAFMEPRVFPTGERPNPSILATAFSSVQQAQISNNQGVWSQKGPFNGDALGGVGRVNKVIFHPNNSSTIWIGTPGGGLWKSTNSGTTWSTNTDLLPNLGVSDIVFDPTDDQIMYIATGDKDAGDTYSYGVLKSTNGGQNWNPTGLSFTLIQQTRISDLYIHPSNPDILIATTRIGIYRTTDAGVNWTNVQSGSFNNLVQKPGDANVLYTSTLGSSDIYKSTDNGVNWTQIPSSSGIPSSGVRRIELAVTPDDPDYVYALCGANNNGFYGLYRTTDNGATWLQQSNSPNLLGWSTSGSDNGGQAWYDLAIAVDPNNKDAVFVGGVNIWGSTDGGINWNLRAHWFGGGGAPYVHADVHHLNFDPAGNFLYAGTDGGVYRRPNTVNNWSSHNDGMDITQYYRISATSIDTTLIIAGAQDNGTHLLDNGNWYSVIGADGMDCALDPSDPNVMYGSSQYGNFRKSDNRGNNFNASFGLPFSVRGTGAWVTPIRVDPLHPDTLYIGYSQIYRSYDAGVSFAPVGGSVTGGNNIDQIAISPTVTRFIYMSDGNDLFRSSDRGDNWTNISNTVPSTATITQITVDYDRPQHLYITFSGYTPGQKIYESFDGGDSWTNISYNLPNIPANCVVPEEGNAHGLYVGTDLGVFYKDKTMTQWIPYNNGLPNVVVNDLEINYNDRKLKAGTYGRGVWQSPLFSDLNAPVADMKFPASVCDNDTVTLEDVSFYNATSWNWSITPGTFNFVNGTNQNSQNPQVTFTQPGVYNVSLTVSNSKGSDSKTVYSALAVGGYPLPFVEDFEDTTSLDKWQIENTAWQNWDRVPVIGSSPGNRAARAYLFYHTGGPYNMITPSLDFRGHDSTKLTFDYAYSGRFAVQQDTLKVHISTDCGNSWALLQAYGEDGTGNFATSTKTNFLFKPASNADWCTNTPAMASCGSIDLTPYAGMQGVRIRFQAVSAGGNVLYLDNISITGKATAAPTPAFSSVQTVCAQTPVSFIDQSYGSPTNYEWTFTGGTPPTSTAKNPMVSYSAPGTYNVKLKVSNAIGADSIIKTSYITVDPANVVSVNITGNLAMPFCSSDTLIATATPVNGGSNPIYNWHLNGNLLYTGSNSVYQFSALNSGDQIYATLESDINCATPVIAMSDTITVNLHPPVALQITSATSFCLSDPSINLQANPSGGTFSGLGVSNGSFDPAIAGSGSHPLKYTYTDNNGCIHTIQTTMVVDAPPLVTFNNIPDLCEGSNRISLNFSSPAGGIYKGTGVYGNFFYPDSAGVGTHSITYVYNQSSCPADSATNTVVVRPNPAKPQILLQNSGSLLVSSVTATNYQWYRNGTSIIGANSQSYAPTINANYSVEVIDQLGCHTESDAFTFNIGLDEFNNAVSFKLYPNPAATEVTIELETRTAPEANLIITNAVGQLVNSRKLEKTTKLIETVDLSKLPSGMYTISVRGDNISVSQKLLIK